jgi:hypothetical protein
MRKTLMIDGQAVSAIPSTFKSTSTGFRLAGKVVLTTAAGRFDVSLEGQPLSAIGPRRSANSGSFGYTLIGKVVIDGQTYQVCNTYATLVGSKAGGTVQPITGQAQIYQITGLAVLVGSKAAGVAVPAAGGRAIASLPAAGRQAAGGRLVARS